MADFQMEAACQGAAHKEISDSRYIGHDSPPAP